MELLFVLLIAVLYGSGIYMLLRRSMVRMLMGFTLIGNGANLLLFLMGGIRSGRPPIIADGHSLFLEAYADPVPQALILTAIVISFGIQSFAIVLLRQVYRLLGSDDLDDLNTPEEDI